VLLRDGKIVSVVRIDLIGEPNRPSPGGIRSDLQRQGHGRVLLWLAEAAARLLGRTEIVINGPPPPRWPSTSPMAIARANGGVMKRCNLIRVGKRLP
jgi:hypothetical protein